MIDPMAYSTTGSFSSPPSPHEPSLLAVSGCFEPFNSATQVQGDWRHIASELVCEGCSPVKGRGAQYTLLQDNREGGQAFPTSLEQNHQDFPKTEYISKFFR